MGRRKKILVYFLALVLAFSYMPSAMGNTGYGGTNISKVSAATEGQLVQHGIITGTNISWKLTVDSTEDWDLTQTPYKLELTGSGNIPDYANIGDTPWYRYYGYIKSLSIGEGITGIGKYSFALLSSLQSVVLPDSVTYIGESGFDSCYVMESFECGSGLRTIGKNAFNNCKELTTVTLNEGLERIEDNAFNWCYMEQITLPESLVYLGECAFTNTPLTSLHIPANVEEIAGNPIIMARKVTQITVSEQNGKFKVLNDILYEMNGDTPYRAVALPSTCRKYELVIPEGTEVVGYGAFFECSLSEVSFPETVTRIESNAFCYNYLEEVVIPDSVEYLGSSAFGSCRYLETVTIGKGLQNWSTPFYESSVVSITISEENPYLISVESVVYSKNGEILYYYPKGRDGTEYHVLDTVTEIAHSAFRNVSKLNELYLPAGLTQIGNMAIYNNTSLHSIYFAGDAPTCQSTTSISYNASDLLLYKLKNSTGWDATINGTSAWDKFTILNWWPDNMLVEEGTVGDVNWKYEASIGRVTFTGTGDVPDYAKEDMIPWEPYLLQIQTIDVEEGVTGIGANAFANATMLVRLRTESDFSYIGDYAFAGDNALKFAQINTAKNIGVEAFAGASELEDALCFYHLEEISAGAFKGCGKIPYVTFGGKLKVISQEVFADCTGVQTCILPETLETLEGGAFRGCTSLRTINIPQNVTFIDANVFADATTLEKVYFYGGIPADWSQEAFTNHSDALTIYHRKARTEWESLNGTWNEIAVIGLDKFYTEGNSHYSFTNTASSFGYSAGYRIPRQRYVDILDITKGSYHYSMQKKWGGSCFGMTSTTLEFYENPEFVVQNYDSDANTVYEITAPRAADAELTKLIETYQISQHLPEIGGLNGDNIKNYLNYNRLIERIEEFERSGGMSVDSQADPIIMTIYSVWGGHAVIPVSVEQTEQGDYMIKIYDPNYGHQFQTAYVSRDMQEFAYLWYEKAAFVDYSVLHEAIENVELDMTAQDESLYISVNAINGTVQTDDGKSIDKIEGAFEQVPLNGGMEEAEFCGVRSYVLPKGSYQIVQEEGENAATVSGLDANPDERVFYVAADDVFVEVVSEDKDAVLNIQDTATEDGTIAMEVVSEQEETTTTYNVTNDVGMERTIEVVGGAAEVTVSQENGIQIKTSEEEETQILVDGQQVSVEEGGKDITFEASADENPWKVEEVETENVLVGTDYLLSGTATASVILNSYEEKTGTVLATLLNKEGEVVASSEEIQKVFTTGLNSVSLDFNACKLADKFTKMTGNLELTCKITVSDAESGSAFDVSDEMNVRLPELPEEPKADFELKVNEKKITLGTGQTYQLKPYFLPKEAKEALTYHASNKNVTVSSKGKITAKKAGTAKVTIKSKSGKIATVTVVVKNFKLVVKEKKLTLGKGETYQLKPSFSPKTFKESLTYRSSNKNVTVNSKGKIKAKKVGTAKITVKSKSGKTATVRVTVKNAPKSIKLNQESKTLKVGKTFKIKVTLPKNTASNKITYTSSKKSVAKVSDTGKVTAVKKGTATITVKTFNGKKAKVKIVVK